MADSTFGAVTLLIRVDSASARFPLPAPVGSPVIRTPNLSGGSNVQAVGYRGLAVTYAVIEFDTMAAYTALVALVGTAATLTLRPGVQTYTYTNAVLDSVGGLEIDVDGVLSTSATFTMDGY